MKQEIIYSELEKRIQEYSPKKVELSLMEKRISKDYTFGLMEKHPEIIEKIKLYGIKALEIIVGSAISVAIATRIQ